MKVAADISPAERVRKAALLIVDMQNDFVRAGAPLEVPEARATIAPIRRLIGGFRSLRRPVVYTRFLAERSPGLMWLWSPQCGPETKCCWEGVSRRYEDAADERDCIAVIDELAPERSDPVRRAQMTTALLVAASLLLVGCGGDDSPEKKPAAQAVCSPRYSFTLSCMTFIT